MIFSWKNSCVLMSLCFCISCSNSSETGQDSFDGVVVAKTLLQSILDKYDVEKYGLLLETYPVNPDHQVTYLAEGAEQKKNQEVSFLWPYSGMLSGLVALYENTNDPAYLALLEERILPGLDLYWDDTRVPYCYQSYPLFNGESDRFYDDNDWLAIDFCDLYRLTKNPKYLQLAEELYEYIYSGWDDLLGGGIYWCEQQKHSKNTCSNAPAAVLSLKLYELTGKEMYLESAKRTYEWTRKWLRDPEDKVYWDNVNLKEEIGKAKFTYNSGQMIQAGVMLYEVTNDPVYLQDARQTAEGSYNYFAVLMPTPQGEQRFYKDMPWFNVILLRGLIALYEVDKDDTYIRTMKENAVYAWEYTRDENGLLGGDWTGERNRKYKWLLDNACMIELYANVSEF